MCIDFWAVSAPEINGWQATASHIGITYSPASFPSFPSCRIWQCILAAGPVAAPLAKSVLCAVGINCVTYPVVKYVAVRVCVFVYALVGKRSERPMSH